MIKTDYVVVAGAGLAGCEAAWQLAKRGIPVRLYEMKPEKFTPAHHSPDFAELVCSNSLGSNDIEKAAGLMKQELRLLDSLLIRIADEKSVPAGQALAVDREGFSRAVTEEIHRTPGIEVIARELTEIPEDRHVLLATGPLTSETLSAKIRELCGSEYLYFYDAAAPIVTAESVDMDHAYLQSRYDKGEGQYINCPLTEEEYGIFYRELLAAERVPPKVFEKEKLFDACMPVEKIAATGEKTLIFGPLKPKGLTNPRTGREDYAVVQLRQDDGAGRLYNLVGFQTNLKWGEQKRVFSLIPALRRAEFVRYGVMHRNTFINSAKLLDGSLCLKSRDNVWFAGQLTAAEGYVCAVATGALAGINIARRIKGRPPFILDERTATGAIIRYITTDNDNLQPMGPNFGVMKGPDPPIRDKRKKAQKMAETAIQYLETKLEEDIFGI
ncbi:MAG: FADH(2)-oxidizing methylenetetrahydrofolate--tRNA-(uracil(54)-C(5))-methyltransferase TrmFO [Fusobacteriaceae bacterium]|jgi:methylenetetrahydrofolate--tRNA-(uracil-5-)-methyltransferase|nr:FADH(2)-oxidizing methylenetetrahydrofolate--tRNA-(uracil(54)-C(5))-methyltransferase TrmFO [Fusobacteriaceae bacterium]